MTLIPVRVVSTIQDVATLLRHAPKAGTEANEESGFCTPAHRTRDGPASRTLPPALVCINARHQAARRLKSKSLLECWS